MPNNKHTEELKEQAREEFRNKFSSPSGLAKIGYSTVDCRPVEDFIDSLIDKTVEYCRQNHRQNN